MKRSFFKRFMVFLPFALLVMGIAMAQDSQFPELAKKVVNTSVGVKPGDVVVISGNARSIPLMEDLAIEAAMAGGMVQVFVDTDRLARTINAEVPEKYLKQEPKYLVNWIKEVDVWIATPDVEDYKASIAGVSQERLAQLNKSGEIVADALNSSKLKYLYIDLPSKADAALFQVPYADLEKMHWDAVNADYRQISDKGNQLKEMLEHASKVHITSAQGTDLTFSVHGRPIVVDAGIVSEAKSHGGVFQNRSVTLPGGSVSFAPVETSGEGKVFAIRERCRPDVQLVGASFDVRDGKITNFKAESGGECYQETMASYSGPKDMLGSVSIGLNPAMKVTEHYRPTAAAGMVWLGFGNNQLLGGKNDKPGGFTFPINNATVEIDGKTVIKDGQLVP